MQVELPVEVASVEILRLQPGDWLIVTTEHHLRDDIRMRLCDSVKELLGTDRCLVLPAGMKFSVMQNAAVAGLADPKERQVEESEVGG